MEDKVKRYCPNCGASVAGEERLFDTPRKCPKCDTLVLFTDALDEPKIKLNAVDTILNKNIIPFNIVAVATLLIALAVLIWGGHGTLILLATFGLIFAVVCLTLYLNQRAAVASLTERKNKFNEVLSKYMVLKNKFNELARDEKLRIENLGAEKIISAERRERQAEERMVAVDELGKRFLEDTLKWTMSRLTPENFVASKERLLKVVEFCRNAGYPFSDGDERKLVSGLKTEYEMVLRRDFEKKEQARIKERIREEQRAQKEFERELARVDAQRTVIEKALDEALQRAKDEYSAEVEDLKAKLREAEEKSERAKSMAEMTRAGHVYVISNIGSFGENVFKIGVSRRLEPLERVRELGDASVPFPFDVHMMIHSDDALALESALHQEFDRLRVNKINFRKEFFKVEFEAIRKAVENHHGEVSYVADAEALQYRESCQLSDEDYEYISKTVKEITEDESVGED